MRALPLPDMRMARMEAQLREARDTGDIVKRSLAQRNIKTPDLSHLDRWLGLLAREQQLALTG